MKKILIYFITFLMIFTSIPLGVFAESQKKDYGWANEEIQDFINKGYTNTNLGNDFNEKLPITRGEFVSLVNKVFNIQDTEENIDFKDITKDNPYYNDIKKAVADGYIDGYEDNTVRVNNPITREEISKILVEVLNIKTDNLLNIKFNDNDQIGDWAKVYVNDLVYLNIFKGYPDNTFRPKELTKRSEAIVLLSRLEKQFSEFTGIRIVLKNNNNTNIEIYKDGNKILGENITTSKDYKLDSGNYKLFINDKVNDIKVRDGYYDYYEINNIENNVSKSTVNNVSKSRSKRLSNNTTNESNNQGVKNQDNNDNKEKNSNELIIKTNEEEIFSKDTPDRTINTYDETIKIINNSKNDLEVSVKTQSGDKKDDYNLFTNNEKSIPLNLGINIIEAKNITNNSIEYAYVFRNSKELKIKDYVKKIDNDYAEMMYDGKIASWNYENNGKQIIAILYHENNELVQDVIKGKYKIGDTIKLEDSIFFPGGLVLRLEGRGELINDNKYINYSDEEKSKLRIYENTEESEVLYFEQLPINEIIDGNYAINESLEIDSENPISQIIGLDGERLDIEKVEKVRTRRSLQTNSNKINNNHYGTSISSMYVAKKQGEIKYELKKNVGIIEDFQSKGESVNFKINLKKLLNENENENPAFDTDLVINFGIDKETNKLNYGFSNVENNKLEGQVLKTKIKANINGSAHLDILELLKNKFSESHESNNKILKGIDIENKKIIGAISFNLVTSNLSITDDAKNPGLAPKMWMILYIEGKELKVGFDVKGEFNNARKMASILCDVGEEEKCKDSIIKTMKLSDQEGEKIKTKIEDKQDKMLLYYLSDDSKKKLDITLSATLDIKEGILFGLSLLNVMPCGFDIYNENKAKLEEQIKLPVDEDYDGTTHSGCINSTANGDILAHFEVKAFEFTYNNNIFTKEIYKYPKDGLCDIDEDEDKDKDKDKDNIKETDSKYFIFDKKTGFITGTTKESKLPLDIIIPSKIDGVDVVGIGKDAFKNTEVQNIYLNKVKKIDDYAFYSVGIRKLDLGNVTTIGQSAFSNNNITELTIPSTVEYIGDFAFSNNKRLGNLKLPEIEKEISINGIKARTIKTGNSPFLGCNLGNVVIPKSWTEIYNNTFNDCKITSLDLGNVKSIGRSAFSDNDLTELTIPSTVEYIGDSAFSYNKKLGNLKLPEIEKEIMVDGINVRTIKTGGSPFQGCPLGNVVIPKSWTEIYNYTFSASQITSLDLGNVEIIKNSAFDGLFSSNNGKEMNIRDLDLKNVKVVEDGAFYNSGIEKLNLGKVEKIGVYSFANNNIKDLLIPETVKNIDYAAFNKNKIKKVEIPRNTYMDNEAFDKKVEIIFENKDSSGNSNTFVPKENIVKASEYAEKNIKYLDLKNVEEIEESAFWRNQIHSLNLKNVKTVGDSAFYGNLIYHINLGGVENIGENAFSNNKISNGDEGLIIPNSVNSIGYSAFANNNIKHLTLPNKKIDLGQFVFLGNELGSLSIPKGLEVIGQSSFARAGITRLTLGHIQRIDRAAFSGNDIKELEIPESVESIGPRAFGHNKNLRNVTIKSRKTKYHKDSFDKDVTVIGGTLIED